MFRLQIFYKNNHKEQNDISEILEIPAIATISIGIIIALTISLIHSLSISLLFVSHSLRQERSDKFDQDLLSPRLTNHRN